MASSYLLVSSLQRVIRRLPPRVSRSSSRVVFSRWGASYSMIVRSSRTSWLRILLCSFLSDGRNPSKQNLRAAIPDMVRAVIRAQAPGMEVTRIPSSIQRAARTSPGSDMAGVPASLTQAIFSPRRR